MDPNELKTLHEAWNQVQGVENTRETYNYSTSSNPIQVSIQESEVLGMMENAMGSVFYGDLQELTTKETREGIKYMVRVKDGKTKSSYTRFATREKIAELRGNPNIASVELTDSGDKNMGGVRSTASGVRPLQKAAPTNVAAPSQVAPTAPAASMAPKGAPMAPAKPAGNRAPQQIKPKTTDHRDADGSSREKKAFSLGKGE